VFARWDPGIDCLVRVEQATLGSDNPLKVGDLLGNRDELELNRVVSQFASLSVSALAVLHDFGAHLGLPGLELHAVSLFLKQVLLNAFLAELLSKLCDLFETLDVFLHLFNVHHIVM